jgi:hypothetical protein
MNRLWLYPLWLIVVPFLMLEGVFRLLPVTDPPYSPPVASADPVARLQPGLDYRYSSGWDFSIIAHKRTNNFGYNFIRDYDPAETTPLLMVIGDSFVQANAVDAGKTAAELLDAGLDGKGRVYSVGLAGAPLSQYLVFAQFAKRTFRPDAMAFFIISNDFDESLRQYASDPRLHYFEESGGQALLTRRGDYEMSPLKTVLRRSAFVRYAMLNVQVVERLEDVLGALRGRKRAAPYLGSRDADTPAALEQRIADAKRAVDHFLDRLPAMSGLASDSIVFVLDAMRPAIYSAQALRLSENSYHAQMRRYFHASAAARGYQVLDMQPVFMARHRLDGARFEFPTDSHWNALANRVVAEELQASALFNRVFGEPGLVPVDARTRPGGR